MPASLLVGLPWPARPKHKFGLAYYSFEVEKRIPVIEFILNMLGLPFNSYVLVRLTDIMAGKIPNVDEECVRPNALVTICTVSSAPSVW